jgi:hypothetical protein
MSYNSESGQSATRRFVDIIGAERLDRGAHMSERGLTPNRLLDAFLTGKEEFILSGLYASHVRMNPYLCDTAQYHAFRSGAGIEQADLRDVVRVMGR